MRRLQLNANTLVITNLDSFSRFESIYSDAFLAVYSTVGENFNAQFKASEAGFSLFVGDRHRFGTGTSIEYESKGGEISIETDILGTEILYYWTCKGRFIISNRMESFSDMRLGVDWASLYQYFVGGYSVGDTTLFADVRQTQCSESLTFVLGSSGYTCAREVVNWRYSASEDAEPEDLLSGLSADVNGTVLMTSAGWDSRTLLYNVNPALVAAYTHGDLSSREIRLAKKLTGDLRMDHLFSDTRNSEISLDTLESMLDELGFALFPLWYNACRRIEDTWGRPVSSGIFGEISGGHWGVDMLLGTRSRLSSLSKFLVPGYRNTMSLDELIGEISPSKDLWYLSADARRVIYGAAGEVVGRIDKELRSYQADDIDRAVEQFMAKHRGRQYLLKQAHCAKGLSGYVLPFAEERFVRLAVGLPFRERVHNKLNRKILMAGRRDLLRYPMAATLCAAHRPVVVQELSRALRLVMEKLTNKKDFGWFNYDFLKTSDLLETVVESLELDIWDKEAMIRRIGELKRLEDHMIIGYTLDTVCKVKTIDHLLPGSSVSSGQ